MCLAKVFRSFSNMSKVTKSWVMLIAALFMAGYANAQVIWDTGHLASVRANINSSFYSLAFENLKAEADRLLGARPLSVMDKDRVAASGDKHDYVSLARYFWRDPSKPDGLPYVNRDGVSNPELEEYDRNRLGNTAENITTLSLAWYLSGDEAYARKAAEMIRVWFLNKDTRMNPNLEYAQMVPGQNGGRGRSYGVLDAYSFVEMLEGVRLLEQSAFFPKQDQRRLREWFKKLTRWMLTSKQGVEEGNAVNNHSIAYDVQVTAFALFAGDKAAAEKTMREFAEKRIMRQIESDGSQPAELTRTLAFGYSVYNLSHIIDMALMSKGVMPADAKARVAKGIDFLVPYMGKDVTAWPYKQISQWESKQQEFCKELYRVAAYTDIENTNFINIFSENRFLDFSDRFWLVYYKPTAEDEMMAFAQKQMRLQSALTDKAKAEKDNASRRLVTPRSVDKDNRLVLVGSHDWCSGFFAGTLWQIYEYTKDDYWRQLAISYTWPIEDAKWHKGSHDLGFIFNNSFGKAYELTGERSYKDVLLQASRTLTTRYNNKVGCIRSWDHNAEVWKYPVIIDNMMNLEMLFRATQLTGDSTFWKIAVNHANTTMRNHFREDYSSYHVVDYDPQTGDVRMKCTAQGYADDSFWSRGQAWGLYGYTMCYRFTKDKAYLEQALHIADFIMSLPMPGDKIPYWDMKAPDIPDAPRDASAAAVIASALYELSDYAGKDKAEMFRRYADSILTSLNNGYRYGAGEGCGFLLRHSVGHLPANSEVDVPLNYADYYYVEALMRKRKHDF